MKLQEIEPQQSFSDYAIGIDIGGTKVMAGVVDTFGQVCEVLTEPSTAEDGSVEKTVEYLVNKLSENFPISSLGVGAAGWIDIKGKNVLFSPHLSWRNEPLKAKLETRLGQEVFLSNDADAAAWAEYSFGAGKHESHLVALTLGTGMGGAIVVDGVIQKGKTGIGGEFGHQILFPGGYLCECGNRGCLEQYASGNALGRQARELAKTNSPMAARLREESKGNIDSIDGVLVTNLARQGDVASLHLYEEMGQWLGVGLANIAAAIDPGLFVLGGGVSQAADLLLQSAQKSYEQNLPGFGYRNLAAIKPAELGVMSGIIGAADLSRHALNGSQKLQETEEKLARID